jgi:hypothetical protein
MRSAESTPWRIFQFIASGLIDGRSFHLGWASVGPDSDKKLRGCCELLHRRRKWPTYAIASKYNRNRFRDWFGAWAGASGRVRFDPTLA